MVDEIIGYYFPEYKYIKIKRKLCDKKFIKIFSRDGKKEYASQQILKIYEKAENIAVNKLNVLNIVYELSRIQFILQSLHGREIF